MWTEREMDDFYDEFEALLLAHNILVRSLIKQGVLDQDAWTGEVRAASDDEKLRPEVRATLGRILAAVKSPRLMLPMG
ncbi:MAG: hypothetical protein AB7O49_14100 [Sphingomonadales bacterium]